MLGTNEYLSGQTVAAYQGYLQSLFNHYTSSPKLIGTAIFNEPFSASTGSSTAPQANFLTAAQSVATQFNSYYFSFASALGGSLAAQQTVCTLPDNIHPNDACQTLMWNKLKADWLATVGTYGWYPVQIGASVGPN